MLEKIRKYIDDNHLPLPPARIITAVSGGADSVAMLLILNELGYETIAAHCNFHLRGEESNRDEMFVRDLCQQHGISLHIQHFDTTGTARREGISIEMAARRLRYEWFEQIRLDLKAAAVAVAHHSDDNAETLLLNLIRGTGLHGLRGMLPRNGHIIRPLLCVDRNELEDYLREKGQHHIEDSTNTEVQYKRNKIRHQLLPLMRTLNPAIHHSLAQTAQHLAEAETLYNFAIAHLQQQACTPLPDGIRINLSALRQLPAPATLLHEWLTAYGFRPQTISQIAENLQRPTGRTFMAQDYMAAIQQESLEIRNIPAPVPMQEIPAAGVLTLPGGRQLTVHHMEQKSPAIPPSREANHATLDADAIRGTLYIRSTASGDRFRPYGMKGSKLVSDLLTDRHRSVIDKQRALAVCDEEGIVWLVNERIAQRAAITPSTRRVISIRYEETM